MLARLAEINDHAGIVVSFGRRFEIPSAERIDADIAVVAFVENIVDA